MEERKEGGKGGGERNIPNQASIKPTAFWSKGGLLNQLSPPPLTSATVFYLW